MHALAAQKRKTAKSLEEQIAAGTPGAVEARDRLLAEADALDGGKPLPDAETRVKEMAKDIARLKKAREDDAEILEANIRERIAMRDERDAARADVLQLQERIRELERAKNAKPTQKGKK